MPRRPTSRRRSLVIERRNSSGSVAIAVRIAASTPRGHACLEVQERHEPGRALDEREPTARRPFSPKKGRPPSVRGRLDRRPQRFGATDATRLVPDGATVEVDQRSLRGCVACADIDHRAPIRIAFESARLSYSYHRVDLHNSGVNQLLNLAAVRGHALWHFRMADLYRHEDRPMIRATILELGREWVRDDPLAAWQHVRPVGTENFDVAEIDLYFVRGDDIRRTDTPNIDVMRAAEQEAIVIESVAATLATCDKYELVERCPEVPQPLTFAATELEQALGAIDRLPLEDGWFVLKDRYGYGCGAQVHRLRRDTPHLDHLVGDYLHAYGDILLQEYRAEVTDGDLVVTFVDDELLGTMRRFPAEGQWKTNASLGAKQVRHELTPEQEDAARAARRAFAECRIASVDLLLSGRVLEINAFPGADGLLETHGVVLAERVLDTLEVELDARPADQHDDQQHDDQQHDDQQHDDQQHDDQDGSP